MKNKNILRMPAEGCRDWLMGRCMREERRNPGYHRSHACTVLARWSDRLDEFYDRAEAMRVAESDLAELWQSRLEKMLPEVRACERFAMGEHPYECANLLDLVCITALPVCEGRCRHYEMASMKQVPQDEE